MLARQAWAALALLSLAGAAWADGVYKCRKPDGGTAFSDRPCPEVDSTQVVRSAAPKAPEAAQFMSPRCVRLREQLNQANNGRTDEATRQQLDYRYQRDCYAEEQEANEKVNQLLEDARNRSLEERQVLAENKARQQLEFSQCVELRNNLRVRRARQAEMNAGERADLQRLSTAFDQRCRGL